MCLYKGVLWVTIVNMKVKVRGTGMLTVLSSGSMLGIIICIWIGILYDNVGIGKYK